MTVSAASFFSLLVVSAQLPETLAQDDESASSSSFLMVAAVTAVCGVLALLYLYKLFAGGPPKVLPLEDFEPFPLIRKEVISHDTRRFVLGLPPGHVLGLPVGQHLSLKFTGPDGKAVQRSYTPVTMDTVLDEVQLVIKVYRPLPPKFPNGGLLSQHLDSLAIGDTILVKGPKGHLHYNGSGKFSTKPLGKPLEQRSCQTIGMMAGGTGITPMLQLLQAIFVHPVYRDAATRVKLLYANQTPNDILVRTELEALQQQFPDRLQVWYTVDRLDDSTKKEDWKYDTGFITKEMVEKHLLFDDDKETQFFMCGPPPMIKFACVPALEACGYSSKNWSIF